MQKSVRASVIFKSTCTCAQLVILWILRIFFFPSFVHGPDGKYREFCAQARRKIAECLRFFQKFSQTASLNTLNLLFSIDCFNILGLYRTSSLVGKSVKIIKSWLSRNQTFSFPDTGLLTLIKIKARLNHQWNKILMILPNISVVCT